MKKTKYILLSLYLVTTHGLVFGQNNSPSVHPQNNGTVPGMDETFIHAAKTGGQLYPPYRTTLLPADYNAQHLGFFCKEEIKMEQVHIPVKLRLGSLEYCNWLEQKPGYRGMVTQPY